MATNDDKADKSDIYAELDIFRDTPVRYLGYANEIGESFRALINVNVVRLTYAIAFGYCLADTADKTKRMAETGKFIDAWDKRKKLFTIAADTLIWQTLASVVIPGFTINRVCKTSLWFLEKYSKQIPSRQKWITTAIGLGSIPFIIKPIDRSVDYVMDKSLRTYYTTKQ